MKRIELIVIIFLMSMICGSSIAAESGNYIDMQLKLSQNTYELNQLKIQNNEIKDDLINRTVGIYELTNDRLNNHISYISLLSTMFGLLIAIGSVWIGYESIKSRKRTDEAIKTLEEAKKYVESKKNEFNTSINERLIDIDIEFQKVLGVLKEQLISDINIATKEVKTLAETKTQELQGYSIEKESDGALESLNRRIAFFENIGIPDDPKILLSKAKLLDEKKMYDEAIELLDKLIKLEPENSKGYWQLGWEFYNKGNDDKAIENYNKCIQLENNNALAYNNLGAAYQRLGKYSEALSAYEKAMSLDNKKALYYHNKARTLKLLNRSDESIGVYVNAIELFPSEKYLYDGAIELLNTQAKHTELLEVYDLAISNIKEHSQSYNYAKAFVLAQSNKSDDAVNLLTALAEQNYKPSECYMKISDILFEQGKRAESICVLDKGIYLNPKESRLYLKKATQLIDDNLDAAYDTIITGSSNINDAIFLQSSARLFIDKQNGLIKSRELYRIAGIMCFKNYIDKPELKDDAREGNMMNYIESLLINEEYDEAIRCLNQYPIVIEKYFYIKEFMILCIKIMQLNPIECGELIESFSSLPVGYSSNWNFSDILSFLRFRTDEKNYNLLSAISELLTKKINYEEFKIKCVG